MSRVVRDIHRRSFQRDCHQSHHRPCPIVASHRLAGYPLHLRLSTRVRLFRLSLHPMRHQHRYLDSQICQVTMHLPLKGKHLDLFQCFRLRIHLRLRRSTGLNPLGRHHHHQRIHHRPDHCNQDYQLLLTFRMWLDNCQHSLHLRCLHNHLRLDQPIDLVHSGRRLHPVLRSNLHHRLNNHHHRCQCNQIGLDRTSQVSCCRHRLLLQEVDYLRIHPRLDRTTVLHLRGKHRPRRLRSTPSR